MATDDERREVAHNIRENYIRGGMGYRVASAYNIATAVGIVPEMLVEDIELWNRLADLIDPDTTTDTTKTAEDTTKYVCDASATVIDTSATRDVSQSRRGGIDRDALLALADEMLSTSIEISSVDSIRPLEAAYLIQGYARRIREALGVER